jgi:hypothetical protein
VRIRGLGDLGSWGCGELAFWDFLDLRTRGFRHCGTCGLGDVGFHVFGTFGNFKTWGFEDVGILERRDLESWGVGDLGSWGLSHQVPKLPYQQIPKSPSLQIPNSLTPQPPNSPTTRWLSIAMYTNLIPLRHLSDIYIYVYFVVSSRQLRLNQVLVLELNRFI